MTLKALIETSVFVSLIRRTTTAYFRFDAWLDRIYGYSRTHKTIKEIWGGVKVCFRYSFLGRITEPKEQNNLALIRNSLFVRRLINVYKEWLYKSVLCFKNSRFYSLTGELIRGMRGDSYYSAVKTVSAIATIVIIANIFFSVILGKEIGLWGWIIRCSLLLVSMGGLTCDCAWENIKKTSFVLRYLNNYCKMRNLPYNNS